MEVWALYPLRDSRSTTIVRQGEARGGTINVEAEVRHSAWESAALYGGRGALAGCGT